jgi:hypothetical protein
MSSLAAAAAEEEAEEAEALGPLLLPALVLQGPLLPCDRGGSRGDRLRLPRWEAPRQREQEEQVAASTTTPALDDGALPHRSHSCSLLLLHRLLLHPPARAGPGSPGTPPWPHRRPRRTSLRRRARP